MKRLSLLFCVFVFFSFLFSLSFATTHIGDSLYQLNVSDSVTSSNSFFVLVTGIAWHYNPNQQIVVDSANYTISFDGAPVATRTLLAGESYTASNFEGKKNVTITAVSLGYNTVIDPESGATSIAPYVNTQVVSKTYVPPAPPAPIIDVFIFQPVTSSGLFDVNISWTTNASANGTVYLMNTSDGIVWKTALDSTFSTGHTAYLSELKSNTYYYFKIKSCTVNSCVTTYNYNFLTKPLIPDISGVNATNVTDTSAAIVWKTDVPSDSTVYYRKKGTYVWTAAPPPGTLDIEKIKSFVIVDNSQIVTKTGGITKTNEPVKRAGSKNEASLDGYVFASSSSIGPGASPAAIVPQDIVSMLIKPSHAIKISGLQADTTYEYLVQSCADQCVNSTLSDAAGYVEPKFDGAIRMVGSGDYLTFKTKRTLIPPDLVINADSSTIAHGSSALIVIARKALSPGSRISSTTLEWDDTDGHHTLNPVFGGDPKSFVPASNDNTAVVSVTFSGTGLFILTVTAKDNYSATSSRTISIQVDPNAACSATGAKYYPSDTGCTDKWPNNGGAGIKYNSPIGACHAYEVCSNDLDYMNAEAESCCSGERIYSDNPQLTRGYDYDKNAACDAAIDNTKKKGAMKTLDAANSMKLCKASYLVYGIGSKAVYLKDYYLGETCCAEDKKLCDSKKYAYFQASNPWPESNIKFNSLYCSYTHYSLVVTSWNERKTGWWGSDTDPSKNNNAMVDAPAHSSVNIMNTGTCVDYSFVTATALRKSGFAANEIMSVRAPGHLYNAIWLPGDSRYTFIDTVGNSGGEFFSGPGWKWNNNMTTHCSYDACSNDLGMRSCPIRGTQMAGC
ncbi:hypothetical protein HY988_03460 [Candidatus Micrarchaeota archaeon]|nr:hypothetical protein [Candidatus Micrarchaeota archaeon]